MSLIEKILELPFEEVIGDRFGRYSKYIIQDRALPDARDGLKPVQRRILYAMYTEGNTADKPFRKSAKTVGTVIGNYHPHGDSSVYDAMVRMSQDWKVRNVLVEMHGNNGSIDGDPQAAMRYTEARLSPLAAELLRDIGKGTVVFAPNFDDSDEEPVVLPARYPNLLVNGSTGISSGYATDIPPHNLAEVIDAVVMYMDNSDVTVDELMSALKGPDFPTGGIIQGIEGIKQAYETGKGKIVLRSKTSFEVMKGGREQIVITEIPYEVVKANVVRKIDELRIDRKVEGIAEVRDETDRTGLRIVIDLKKDADAEGVLAYLFKNTDLQVTYSFNMVAIAHKTPQLMNLRSLLDAYVVHQKEVVTRRCEYDLEKAKDRQHVVEGLIKALSILDELIAKIRASKDKADAKNNIIEAFGFTERQAEAIVNLQLYRLTNTDVTQLQREAEELEKTVQKLEAILGSEAKLIRVIKKELEEIKATYADARRSEIQAEIEEIKINLEVMVPAEDVIITVTKDGYVKRTSLRSYSASTPEELGRKDEDELFLQLDSNTTDTLLLFTNKGNYLYIPVHSLPDIRWKDIGQHIANIIPIEKDERIIEGYSIKSFAEKDKFLLFVTQNGVVKRSSLSEYQVQRYSKPIVATKLKDEDQVIRVFMTDGKQEIILVSHQSFMLRFDEEEVSVMGQKAAGVRGISLKENDRVVDAIVFAEFDQIQDITLHTQKNADKKVPLRELVRATRARRGSKMIKELKTNPHRVTEVKVEFKPIKEEEAPGGIL
ncbi:DNA topoisomerase IV subunit A [Bacillus horti]|uniref:DNA topoisomerase 4 subunit A n=1 Tax=Caldalkalibacillus horti TaxID=77523 RepID=A0ABT9VY44_9BACI|nr:DNA topoisomerase IV subunit A [Bacillus horti]MDQ0165540.1 topoisomerase-4 subunit A [Bacillus horti]